MYKSFIFFLLGAAASGGIIAGSAYYLTKSNASAPQAGNLTPKTAVVVPPTQPTSQPAPQNNQPASSAAVNTNKARILSMLQQRLYKEGIKVQASVTEVYPSIGFIMNEDSASSIFTAWESTAPAVG